MKIVGVVVGLCLGVVGYSQGAKYSLDPGIYNAVYMLNTELVKAMLAEHDALSLEEKQHLLDLVRRRVDVCSQKTLTTTEKFDKMLFGLKLIGKGLLLWWVATIVNRWVDYWFRPENESWYGRPTFIGLVLDLLCYLNPLQNSFEYEQRVLNFIAGELSNKAGLRRVMYFLVALGTAFHLTGIYKASSLVMHLGRDQDLRKAEELEFIISSMPIRS